MCAEIRQAHTEIELTELGSGLGVRGSGFGVRGSGCFSPNLGPRTRYSLSHVRLGRMEPLTGVFGILPRRVSAASSPTRRHMMRKVSSA